MALLFSIAAFGCARADALCAGGRTNPLQRGPGPWFRSCIFALLLSSATTQASAQEFAFAWDPRTGDTWVDETLADINRYGVRYRPAFENELVRYHGVPPELVSELLGPRRWAPGDVYFACATAQVLGRPCRTIAQEWQQAHADGWEALVRRLGAEPGSDTFDRIKRGIVPSYDRWNRPIALDDDLQRAFPAGGKQRPYRWTPPQPDKPVRKQPRRQPD